MSIAAQLLENVHQKVGARLDYARGQIAATIASGAPSDTGELRSKIRVDQWQRNGDRWTSRVVADAPQASYTDEGTGVFAGRGRIYPKNPNGVLVFFWKGGPAGAKTYAFKSVAGQPAQRWWSGDGVLAAAYRNGLDGVFE